jgi:hypothetical protein
VSIHIYIASLWLPILWTAIGSCLMILVGWLESRDLGDYAIPMFSILSFVAWVSTSIAVWTFWLAYHYGWIKP